MKTFLKILAGILALMIVITVGLNIYFTDERLKDTVMPYVNEAVGRPVHVGSMSLTLFSTFPQPGLSISQMSIPGEGESEADTLMALDELVVGVKLFSLFGDEIEVSEIRLDRPRFTYTVFKDSTSNIDFLLSSDAEEDTSQGYAVNIPYFEVSNGQLGYVDQTSDTDIKLEDLSANISLRYANLIESTVDIQLGGLYATADSVQFVNGLPLSLREESTIDLDNETVTLQEGTFSIRGLALNLSGNIKNWGSTPAVDLSFTSSSDNFGELLRLAPASYEEYTQELETRGSLAIAGSVNGPVGGKEIPSFNLSVDVKDGYVKNPDLPEPIENIQLAASASNELLTIKNLNAIAGSNNLSANGTLKNPLEENGQFDLDLTADVDLATVNKFYDLNQFDIEKLGGKLDIKANAKGNRDKPKNAVFDADAKLVNGLLKYKEVPKSIENINIDAVANQEVVTVKRMNLEAAQNTFSLKGIINKPLDENSRTVDVDTELRFDLATVKEFYPVSEDSLAMRGMLTAQASLKGKADQIERSVESGSINLTNGFIDYKKIGKPFRDITLESVLDGPRLTVVNASFKSGDNTMKASGLITDYLSEDRKVNLKVNGDIRLNEMQDFYDLKPNISSLTGSATMKLQAEGPLKTPANMTFNGNLKLSNVNVEGDSLPQPVKNLNGQLKLTPQAASLEKLTFQLGSSDMDVTGKLEQYMAFLQDPSKRKQTPKLSGNFHSKYLDVDELIDWEEESSDEPIPINLPDLNTTVTAKIDKMTATGVQMNNLQAQASTTPKQIRLDRASVEMFEGKANGSFTWDVPRPDRTKLAFKGELDSLRAEAFFREYNILGEKSDFHEHISGAFSAKVDYTTELDEYLNPILKSTDMSGNFGMTKARLQNHPVQDKLANFFKANEFHNAALDQWKTTFSVDNNILNFKDFRLSSDDVGIEMDGTQHLVSEKIDYKLKVLLPSRFKDDVAKVITQQAADALTRKDGNIMVPLRITGTLGDTQVRADEEVIRPIIKQYLKGKAGNALKKLFGNG